jgi:hypothetical protein
VSGKPVRHPPPEIEQQLRKRAGISVYKSPLAERRVSFFKEQAHVGSAARVNVFETPRSIIY